MTELDTTVDDVTTDVDTDIDTIDTDDFDNLTVDDYKKEKARREKAEKTLVELKRKAKELESKVSTPKEIDDAELDKRLEKREFLKENKELLEYKEEFEAKVKLGLSFEEAKTLVLSSDKAKANREKLNSLGLSDGEAHNSNQTITKSELAKLASNKDLSEYNRIRDLMESGKVKLR